MSSGLSYFPRITSMACLKPRILIHRYQKVKKIAPNISTSTINGTWMVFFFAVPEPSKTGLPSRSTSSICIEPRVTSKNSTLKILLLTPARNEGAVSALSSLPCDQTGNTHETNAKTRIKIPANIFLLPYINFW